MGFAKSNIRNMSKVVKKYGQQQNVLYAHSRFLEFDIGHNMYDAITCIQVIQHIPTTELPNWLKAAFHALKPGGVFVLASTFRDKPQLGIQDTPVSEDKFNARAEGKDVDKWGASKLAVRYYGYAEFEQLAQAAGFKVLDHGKFLWNQRNKPTHQWIALSKEDPTGEVELPKAVPTRIKEVFFSSMELATMENIKMARDSGKCTPKPLTTFFNMQGGTG